MQGKSWGEAGAAAVLSSPEDHQPLPAWTAINP